MIATVGAMTAIALVATACSGGDSKGTPTPTPASPDASRAAATLVRSNPLTGLATPQGVPQHPVFVVKIENTANGAPQYGLSSADLVVEELVEGGLTRLAAFFYTQTPSKVGHVRSTRTSDIGLVKPTKGQLLASGGAGVAIRQIKRAGVDLHSEDTRNLTLTKDPAKVAPYNRLLDLASCAKVNTSPDAPVPSPYLPFGASATAGTTKAGTADVRFSRDSTTRWRYADGTYRRLNGHAQKGKDFAPSTVLVLYTKQKVAGYRDPAGNPVPETVLTGGGKATVLNGGTALDARWAKKNDASSFTLEAGGKPLHLKPGKVFIELVPVGDGAVTTRP